MAFLDQPPTPSVLDIRARYHAGELDDDRIRCIDCKRYQYALSKCSMPGGGTDPGKLRRCNRYEHRLSQGLQNAD